MTTPEVLTWLKDVGAIGLLLVFMYLWLGGKFVSGKIYDDIRAERDKWQGVAEKLADTLSQSANSVDKLTESHKALTVSVNDLARAVQRAVPIDPDRRIVS